MRGSLLQLVGSRVGGEGHLPGRSQRPPDADAGRVLPKPGQPVRGRPLPAPPHEGQVRQAGLGVLCGKISTKVNYLLK